MLYNLQGCSIFTEPTLNKQIRITNLITNKSVLATLNEHNADIDLSTDLDITIENVGKTFYLSLEII